MNKKIIFLSCVGLSNKECTELINVLKRLDLGYEFIVSAKKIEALSKSDVKKFYQEMGLLLKD